MFFFDSKTGMIIPLPLHWLWKYKLYIFVGSWFLFAIAGVGYSMYQAITPPPYKSPAIEKEWKPSGCNHPMKKIDQDFCRNFKGL